MDIEYDGDGHQLVAVAGKDAQGQGAGHPGPDTYHPGNPDSVFAGALLSRGVFDDLHLGEMAGVCRWEWKDSVGSSLCVGVRASCCFCTS